MLNSYLKPDWKLAKTFSAPIPFPHMLYQNIKQRFGVRTASLGVDIIATSFLRRGLLASMYKYFPKEF